MRLSRTAAIIVSVLAVASCDSTSPLAGNVGTSGGTVASDNSAARVVVPPGALASAMDITVSPSTDAPATPGLVTAAAYEFGPTGTTFTSPVTITIKYDPATLPANVPESSLKLYTSTGSTWTLVPGSTVDLSAHTVSGATTHFSRYAPIGVVAVSTVVVTAPATTIAAGSSTQASAATLDGSGAALTGRVVTWSTSDATKATVSASGLVTGVAAGTATITATSEGKSGTLVVTVTPPPVATVAVTPATSNIVVGGTTTLSAATADASGAVLTGRVVVWSSSDITKATVSATGVVTGVAPGSATITATSEGKSGSAIVTVTQVPVATVTLTPSTLTLAPGASATITATTKDASAATLTGRVVTWSNSNTAVATVSATGVVTGVSSGSATITATSEGKSATAVVSVAVPVSTITISPSNPTVAVGGTVSLFATPRDAAGNVLGGRSLSWTSSNTNIATVSAGGLVTGVGAGTAAIFAIIDGVSSSVNVTVTGGGTVVVVPVATVTVAPALPNLVVGGTVQLVATTSDANGNVLTGRLVTWSSSDPNTATVSSTGLVTAVAAGNALIVATSQGIRGGANVTIAVVPVATVTVTPATSSVNTGAATQLIAAMRDANGNVLAGRLVAWSSSDQSKATVNGSGVVTGIAAGTVTITAVSEGKTGTASVTVVLDPVATVTVSPSVTNIAVGATGALSANTSNANGVTLSGRLVTWSSSDLSKVTVSATGVVTGVAAGSATITATSEGKTGTATVNVSAASSGTTVPLALRAISTGDNHACGLTTTGAAYCWGAGGNGLGNGNNADSHVPIAVVGGLTFASIGVESNLSCGITMSNVLYCWGAGAQLGQNLTPASIAPGIAFVSVSVNSNHMCGVATDGTGYCVGDNRYGALGSGQAQGALPASTTMLPVAGGLHWKQLATSNWSTCGIATDNALYCWGNISSYNSGTGAVSSSASPVLITNAVTFASLTPKIGTVAVCGLTATGASYCVGGNTAEFGAGTATNAQTPLRVGGTQTFKSLTHGGDNLCGVGTDDALYCWGSNGVGQLGQPSGPAKTTPQVVLAGRTFSATDIGQQASVCAIAADGVGYCWGNNFNGQVGDNTTANRSAPTGILGGLVFRTP